MVDAATLPALFAAGEFMGDSPATDGVVKKNEDAGIVIKRTTERCELEGFQIVADNPHAHLVPALACFAEEQADSRGSSSAHLAQKIGASHLYYYYLAFELLGPPTFEKSKANAASLLDAVAHLRVPRPRMRRAERTSTDVNRRQQRAPRWERSCGGTETPRVPEDTAVWRAVRRRGRCQPRHRRESDPVHARGRLCMQERNGLPNSNRGLTTRQPAVAQKLSRWRT
jgi:hypothetical protein